MCIDFSVYLDICLHMKLLFIVAIFIESKKWKVCMLLIYHLYTLKFHSTCTAFIVRENSKDIYIWNALSVFRAVGEAVTWPCTPNCHIGAGVLALFAEGILSHAGVLGSCHAFLCSEETAHVWHRDPGVSAAWHWSPEEAWGHMVHSVCSEVSAHRYVSLPVSHCEAAVLPLSAFLPALSSCMGKKMAWWLCSF